MTVKGAQSRLTLSLYIKRSWKRVDSCKRWPGFRRWDGWHQKDGSWGSPGGRKLLQGRQVKGPRHSQVQLRRADAGRRDIRGNGRKERSVDHWDRKDRHQGLGRGSDWSLRGRGQARHPSAGIGLRRGGNWRLRASQLRGRPGRPDGRDSRPCPLFPLQIESRNSLFRLTTVSLF